MPVQSNYYRVRVETGQVSDSALCMIITVIRVKTGQVSDSVI